MAAWRLFYMYILNFFHHQYCQLILYLKYRCLCDFCAPLQLCYPRESSVTHLWNNFNQWERGILLLANSRHFPALNQYGNRGSCSWPIACISQPLANQWEQGILPQANSRHFPNGKVFDQIEGIVEVHYLPIERSVTF